jgi:Protein of unknown function (DUF2723)
VHKAIGTLAVLFLAAHLLFLPPSLEDLDSVNFALGVRSFDVAHHQPHPPGYPAFIALAKLSTSALAIAGVPGSDVSGLAVWSAVAGALMLVLLFSFFGRIDDGAEATRRAVIAVVLVACCPLVWFNAARPMSDVAGLSAAFAALASCAWALTPGAPGSGSRTTLVAGAFFAGLAIGFRSQMALLTLPMLAFVLVVRRSQAVPLVGAAAAGVLVWAVPLVVLSGGPSAYIAALGSQAGDDFTGVVMLWTNPTPRVAIEAALHTFVRPWASPALGGVLIAMSIGGAWMQARRAPRVLALLAVAFGPYAIFHLLFQEPLTTRYALPLIPVTAYLSATLIAGSPARMSAILATALAALSLSHAVPPALAFGREASPFFSLLSEMRLLQARGAHPIVGMHRRVFTESRRARVYAGELPGTILPTPRDYEWLELTRAWRDGHDGDAWFIADPRRTDLALIDSAHARVRRYRWPFSSALYLGGTRPDELDWHVFSQPGWFLEQGWALTPEAAGIAARDGWGPHRRPSVGWVRRRPGETVMMIGGRQLSGDPPVEVVVRLDDRPAAMLTVRPGFFLDFVTLPAGMLAGDGWYAKLSVIAQASGGGAAAPVAIEQFNLQASETVQSGFDQGWHEPEYNPRTGRSWRWMSDRAAVRVHHAGRPVTLRLAGESPRHYFDTAPLVRVLAGEQVLAEARPSADFTMEVPIAPDVLATAGGRITIASDRSFVAGEREGTADRRRLALRIFSVDVEARR